MFTKTLAIGAATAAITTMSFAAPGNIGIAALPVQAIEIVEIPRLDFESIDDEDYRRLVDGDPYRYAIPHTTSTTPGTAGTWERLDDSTLMWRLRVISQDATSINLAFERFTLPESGVLSISTTDGSSEIRPFTADDNNRDNQLWTPPVPGDDILIEIQIDERDRDFIEQSIALTRINVGYRGFYDFAAPNRSGSCNYDVACSEADEWRDEIPGIAAISTGGSLFCTGFMVNNVRQDGTPLFMTANHCGINSGNAASLVAYWNYEDDFSANLDCPGSASETGTLNQFTTGSTFRASYADSDFTIVELNSVPDESFGVAYCGWDARDQITNCSVAIHHPSTDAKRWSIDYDDSEIYGYNQPGSTHIRIVDWDLGTTEPGSSGSPLFDCTTHRVVGQLHGGYAACGNDSEDWYGRMAVSWNNGLSEVLDPDGTGALFVDTLGGGLSITPNVDVLHYGDIGGPFTDPVISYALVNNSPDPVQYRVTQSGSFGLNINGNSLPASGTLAANGGEAFVSVSVSPTADNLGAGRYENNLVFEDVTNDTDRTLIHTLEVAISDFTTDPEFNFVAGGPVGGPFPSSQTYTVTSLRPTDTQIEVTSDVDWISINGLESLTIDLDEEGDTQAVTIGFSDAANDLSAGIRTGTVYFTNSSGDGSTSRDITLDVGRFTYAAYDTPIAISDNSTITSSIEVGDSYCIGDVDVEMDISHTFIGDLAVDLTSPEGTTVRLHDRSGGGDDDIVVTYDDDGTAPAGSLADFDGENVAGTWTLTVSDNAGADTGSLNDWKLKIGSSGETCPPPAFDQSVFCDENSFVLIELFGGSPAENSYVITSLPAHGSLESSIGTPINNVPFAMPDNNVRYEADTGYFGPDDFTFQVTDGTQYSEDAVVSIQVGALANPDECPQAAPIANGTWEYDTTDATTDGSAHESCDFDGQTYNDIWYSYVACGDGELLVTTCSDLGGSADYDTDLVVYGGTDCADLTLLGCNDDDPNNPCGGTDGGYASTVIVTVTEGEEYLIRVGGWNADASGTGMLLVEGPAGDCTGEPCPGDYDEDGTVGVNDLLYVIGLWQNPYTVDELLLVISYWNQSCP